ncbi:MAG: hypothetical protein IKB46_03710, partial [Paludibacteraceae bacterium]|nr:hypothetical protein [Paludibacteraceae bacterium]
CTFGRRLLETILISLCLNEFSNIPPKLRSQNAEHTTVREQYFLKIRLHLLHPISNTSLSSELE